MRKVSLLSPHGPEREHLAQRFLIGEDHEETTLESLVGSSLSVVAQSEEVVIRGDVYFLDLAEPLHSRDLLHGSDEAFDCADGLEHYDLFGDEPLGLGLQPRPTSVKGPLELFE